MAKYLSNAFSLQMLTASDVDINVIEVDKSQVPFGELISTIGHQDIADLLGVPINRVNTRINKDDILYVAQYIGDRLPEGVTTLPEGAVIKFFRVTVNYNKKDIYAVKAGDKFTSNFCEGIVTVREIVNESAIMDFEDKREPQRNGELWFICDIISELQSSDLVRVHATSASTEGDTRIWLRNESDNHQDGIWVDREDLQRVLCRELNESAQQLQVQYKGDWYYANPSDFE